MCRSEAVAFLIKLQGWYRRAERDFFSVKGSRVTVKAWDIGKSVGYLKYLPHVRYVYSKEELRKGGRVSWTKSKPHIYQELMRLTIYIYS